MTDAMVIYRAEANLGDRIVVTLYLDDIGTRSFDLYYLLRNGQQEIARVKTGIAFFDSTLRRTTACPEGFIQRFGGSEV